jgi:predicted site-specific integrase-resolvase
MVCRMNKADLITLTVARNILGVSRTKIWRLVREGTLTVYVNPLDRREKLVRRSQVEALLKNAEALAA